MEWLGTLLGVVIWVVVVPLVAFGGLKAVGYDREKPSLIWRTKAGPLPLWVYLTVIVVLGVVLILTAATR